MDIAVYFIWVLIALPFVIIIALEIAKRKGHTLKVKAELLSVESDDESYYGVYRYNKGTQYTCKISLNKDRPPTAPSGFDEFKASLYFEGIAPKRDQWPKDRVLLIDPKNPSSAIKNENDNKERNKNDLKADIIVLAVILGIFITVIYICYINGVFDGIS